MAQMSAGGQLARVSAAVPVAEAGGSCCAACAGRGCHWCVCHSLGVQSAGVIDLEPLDDGPEVAVVWWVEVVVVCAEHGERRGCTPLITGSVSKSVHRSINSSRVSSARS